MEKNMNQNTFALDVRLALAASICCLTAIILSKLGLTFQYGERSLEIIQKMTAAISCLLCCQDTVPITKKSGMTRIIITAVGGVLAVLVILVDNLLGNEWAMVPLFFIGILLTLHFCKLAKVPYVSARIGAVSFVLVACTLQGSSRIWYAIFRLISTVYGAIISVLVTWVLLKIGKKRA